MYINKFWSSFQCFSFTLFRILEIYCVCTVYIVWILMVACAWEMCWTSTMMCVRSIRGICDCTLLCMKCCQWIDVWFLDMNGCSLVASYHNTFKKWQPLYESNFREYNNNYCRFFVNVLVVFLSPLALTFGHVTVPVDWFSKPCFSLWDCARSVIQIDFIGS